MNNFAIRVTMSEETDLSGIYAYLADRANVVVVCRHTKETNTIKIGDSPHVHIHVGGCTVDTKTILGKLTQLKAPKGNKGRSCKDTYGKAPNIKPVDSGNISYISKGRLEPEFLKGVSISEFNSLRSNWVDYGVVESRTQGREAPSPGQPKKKKLTTYGQWEEVMRRLRTIPYQCNCNICNANSQTNLIGGIMWNEYDEHENYTHCCTVIREVRKEQGLMTDARIRKPFLEMIYTEGHERECDYSEEIREVKKWGWN